MDSLDQAQSTSAGASGMNKSPSIFGMWETSGTSLAAPLILTTLKTFQNRDDLSALILERQIQDLPHSYAILSDDAHIGVALQDVPALFPLLTDAVQPLRSIFGDEGLFQLETLESDEGIILRVIVKLPHNDFNAAELMSKFNNDWWIDNCARSQASLVFDYETGDAV